MAHQIGLNDFEKDLVEEISVISGHSQASIREIWEFTFLNMIDQYMDRKPVRIPFLGTVFIRNEPSEGSELTVFASVSDLMKKIIAEVDDGDSEFLNSLFHKKIKMELNKKLES